MRNVPAPELLRLAAPWVAFLANILPGHAASGAAPDFELLKWEASEKVRLSDFAGEILVLDFFAYWCVPCRKASLEIEGGIQKFYTARKGNPHGVPVRVAAINIERDNPKQTAQYIQEIRLELVLNDFDSVLLEKLGGGGTPFIVVIDGTRATKDQPDFRIVYKSEGFAGTKKLRQVIDRIQAPKPAYTKPDDGKEKIIEKATGPPTIRRGEIAFESMLASDIEITSTVLSYGQKLAATEWRVNYSHNTIHEDYEPFRQFDFLGYSEELDEQFNSGQLSLRQQLGDRLTLLGAGGGYAGSPIFAHCGSRTTTSNNSALCQATRNPTPKASTARPVYAGSTSPRRASWMRASSTGTTKSRPATISSRKQAACSAAEKCFTRTRRR